MALGIGLCALLVAGGSLAAVTTITSAVIAPGRIVVESDVKKVQHPTGGVVGELRVREGARVKAGDILIRLDETQTRAGLDILRKAIDELSARRARDEAERDGATSITFPAELLARKDSDPVVARLIDGETHLFVSRVAGREGQKSQLRERVLQLRQEVDGVTQQAGAKDREIALIGEELKGVRQLYAQNLVPFTRLNTLERTSAGLNGDRGRLTASIAATQGKIAETELQILQIDQDMHTEVGKDLAEVRSKWSELAEKRIAAEDQLKRVDMRAPQDGIVHDLKVHTIGGLVTPSEPAMLIVPDSDQLVVEVQVDPQEIDRIRVDQPTLLRFPTLNQSETPDIAGTISRVAADVSQDPKTGAPFYTVRIRPTAGQKERLGSSVLVPGLPVEAHMQIGDRTILNYLVSPMTAQIEKRQNAAERAKTDGS